MNKVPSSYGSARRSAQPLGVARAHIYRITAAVVAFLAGPVLACSWSGISQENVATVLPARLQDADAVVHARVVAVRVVPQERVTTEGAAVVLLEKHVASLLVLRSFKGGSPRMEVTAITIMCGHQFSVGEENVYFIRNGQVGLPNVEPATPWLLAALERAPKATPTPRWSERVKDEGTSPSVGARAAQLNH
jgi:hypothetical protein